VAAQRLRTARWRLLHIVVLSVLLQATRWPHHPDRWIKKIKYSTVYQWCASKCAAGELNFWGLFFPWGLNSPIPFNAVGESPNEWTFHSNWGRGGRNFVCLTNTSFNHQKWVCRWIYLFSLLAVESLFSILRVFEQISLIENCQNAGNKYSCTSPSF
jgi:hypothetical protein